MWSLLDFFSKAQIPYINILDIGAALGEEPSYQSLVDAGRARIIGFEPNDKECERLNELYGSPHLFLPFFAGNGQSAIFHETNWSLTGSLYEPNTPLLEKFQNLAELTTPVAQHKVETKRIDQITEIGEVDFIKIDVQGSELSIFENAKNILADALVIQTEVEFVELYKGQPMFADVDIFLRAHGFQFCTFLGFGCRAFKPLICNANINQGFKQALWSDAIYVKDWMILEEISALKLTRYAVLAHDILGAYDLAHLILTALDKKTNTHYAELYLSRLTKV